MAGNNTLILPENREYFSSFANICRCYYIYTGTVSRNEKSNSRTISISGTLTYEDELNRFSWNSKARGLSIFGIHQTKCRY